MSSSQALPNIEINPEVNAQKTIIWLHGLGADGSDFVPFVPELDLPKTMRIRFIFPHAPSIPVTINNGYKMPAWYNISSPLLSEAIDEVGIRASVNSVAALIAREEERGIAPDQIILGGFSQGAVIALTAGLSYPRPLGGIIALSGYLPQAANLLKQLNNQKGMNTNVPIFIGHGSQDTIVLYALGKSAYVHLKQAGYNASWHSYQMGHSVCAQEIVDIRHWIEECWRF